MSAFLIMVAVLLASTLLNAFALVLVARWLRYQRAFFSTALLVASLWLLLGFVLFYVNMRLVDAKMNQNAVGLLIFEVCALIAFEVYSIRIIQKTTDTKAFAGWAVTLIPRFAFMVAVLLGIRGRLIEAYQEPSLAMAPTLLSRHATISCPRCGGTLYVDLGDAATRVRMVSPSSALAPVCMNCRQQIDIPVAALKPEPADRFFVTKFLTAERWDLISFRHAENVYAKRLVALPGEEISIDSEGHLFINGKRLDPPEEIPGSLFRWPTLGLSDLALRPGTKLLLGPDEFFVLGDNAERSQDSRFIGPIHSADIDGVVTWIYWPLSRMRIVR